MTSVQSPEETAANVMQGFADAMRQAIEEAPPELVPGIRFAQRCADDIAAKYRAKQST